MHSFSHTSRTVALTASIFGGIVLLGVGSTAALATFGTPFSASSNSTGPGETQSIDVSDITGVAVDSSAASFTLVFADVPEATLEIEGQSQARWEMSIDDGDLLVHNAQRFPFLCIGWCSVGDQLVTLTLPQKLDTGALDAEIVVNAGDIDAGGSFRDLDINVNAGELTFAGSARSLDASVNAGRATIGVEGVREADLEIAAGRLDAELTGNQPQTVSLDVSAGQLRLTVPFGSYDVRSDVSAGSLDNQLNISSGSSHHIDANISAGTATLRTP